MASLYRKNPSGMRDLVRSPGVGAAMVQAAQKGKEFAEQNAPRRTGRYASSFVVKPAKVTVRGEPRAGAQLENTAPYAAAIEWGRGGRHVLQRSVDAIEKG